MILTCLHAEYVNMLNTAKSTGGPRKQTGWHSPAPRTESPPVREVHECVYLCAKNISFPNKISAPFGKPLLPKRCIPVTHWSLMPPINITHMRTRTQSWSIPSASSLSAAHLLGEVAADVQGLLVHLSHVLQVPQQGEAAIVPRGAFRFGAAAELGSLERRGRLEALEVGELQQVFR